MLWLLATLACKDNGEDTGETPPIRSEDTAVCKGHDPVLTRFELANGGMVDFDGTEAPTIQLQADATDEDGNLDAITLEIWWEGDADGSVDTSGAPDSEKTWTLMSDSECSVFDTADSPATIALNLQVGGAIPTNSPYDFAIRITDSEGEVSNVLTATGVTPKSDGSDGDSD